MTITHLPTVVSRDNASMTNTLDTPDTDTGSRTYSQAIRDEARLAWLSGEPVSSIVKRLGINSRRVVYRWREGEGWDNQRPPESALVATTRRYNALIDKEDKADSDWQEIDKLADLILRFEKIEAAKNGECLGVGRTPGVKNGEGKRRSKKNDITAVALDDFDKFETGFAADGSPNLYPHQKKLLLAAEINRILFHLKGRQQGATYTFAYRAWKRAITLGHNQIFISSTKAQAEVFKSYISIIARAHFGVELSGNPVKLYKDGQPWAELHFLSPNAFADSRSGDVYFDECFKTRNWTKMEAIAAPMATLKQYTKCYFSSPTAVSHPAYEIWSGERFKRHHPDIDIDVTVPPQGNCELTNGRLDPDGIYRIAFTIHDCIRMGWDKVDLEQLKLEMPDPKLFAVTYEGQFIDDSNSVFKLEDILKCGVNTKEAWPDIDLNADKPAGNLPCTGGYDPAAIGDNASKVTMTFPRNIDEKFRLLQKRVWHGVSAPTQVEVIRQDAERFNYDYFEVDGTGPGLFIPDFLREFLVNIVVIQYNPVRVALMIQKGQSVILANRFEYDENDQTLPLAFLTIFMSGTENGIVKYQSRRSDKVGHGDEAWACLHAFMCEPLNPQSVGHFRASVHE